MTIIEKTVKGLEKLRSARNVEIYIIKMSKSASDIFYASEEGYDIVRGKKYVERFSDVRVFIDPYVYGEWVQIYYKTPVSSLNTVTITKDSKDA